jgi:hypothetical protein
MELLVLIIILLIVVYVIYYNCFYETEKYGSGALLQLVAKGPQDSYLTVGTDRYVPEFYFPYGEFAWNNPTRLNNYLYYPPYYLPYYNYLFPYTLYDPSFWLY